MMNVADQTSLSSQANLALGTAQNRAATAPTGADPEALRKTSEKFVGMFMSQMFSQMFSGVGTNSLFGGGQGEEMFKSVLIDEYGKAAAKQGGLGGMTDQIMHALIAQQEKQS
jgi:Rod binding domain-containing protein